MSTNSFSFLFKKDGWDVFDFLLRIQVLEELAQTGDVNTMTSSTFSRLFQTQTVVSMVAFLSWKFCAQLHLIKNEGTWNVLSLFQRLYFNFKLKVKLWKKIVTFDSVWISWSIFETVWDIGLNPNFRGNFDIFGQFFWKKKYILNILVNFWPFCKKNIDNFLAKKGKI